MKRIIAITLALIIFLGTFSSCSSVEKTELTKGEFYALVMENFNYYPLNATEEEMEETDNYDIEAQTMVDWYLLTKELAFKNINKSITREEAALICLNTLYIKKSGKPSDFKDYDICNYPQEMADAVANGILKTENGYIDAKQPISQEEAIEMLNATVKAATENVYDEDEAVCGFDDNCAVLTSDDLSKLDENEFVIEGYEAADAAANSGNVEAEEMDTSGLPEATVVPLGLNSTDKAEVKQIAKKSTEFRVRMPKSFYQKNFSTVKINDIIVYTGNSFGNFGGKQDVFGGKLDPNPFYKLAPFSGKLIEIIDYEERKQTPNNWNSPGPCVEFKLTAIKDREKVANSKIENVTKQIKFTGFKQLEKSIAGFTIKIDKIGSKTNASGLKLTVSKKFSLSQGKYNNWRDWKANPTATFTASIDNVYITTNKLQNFFKKGKQDAYFKITSDTSESISLESGGLRFTPDSNRNGKFFSNLTNSRLTAGQGAKSIKVAKVPFEIPYAGLSIELGVYLVIGVDGKITVTLSQAGNGFELEKNKNGEVSVSRLGTDSLNAKVNVNANIELKAEFNLTFCILPKKPIMSGDLAIGADIVALMDVYIFDKDGNPQKECTGYGDPDEAEAVRSMDYPDTHYCVNVNIKPYLRGGLLNENTAGEKNLVAQCAKELGYDLSKCSFKLNSDSEIFAKSKIKPEFNFHYENGGFVDVCTLSKKDAEKDKESSEANDDQFILSRTKVIMEKTDTEVVYIVESPISDKQIKKQKGIKVKSKNENVATVSYNEKDKSMMVVAVGPGSTEIEVYLKKNKKSKKQYTQSFSVTITEDKVEASGLSYGVIIPFIPQDVLYV